MKKKKSKSKKILLEMLEEEKEELKERKIRIKIQRIIDLILGSLGLNGDDLLEKRREQFRDDDEMPDDISEEELQKLIDNYKPKRFYIDFGFGSLAFTIIYIVILLSICLIGAANSPKWGDIVNWGKKVLNIAVNEQTQIDDKEAIWTDDTRTYNTLVEAIEKENLDIVYPKTLPDGVKENKTIITKLGESIKIRIEYDLPNEILFLLIENKEMPLIDESAEQYISGDVVHYILKEDDIIDVIWRIGEYSYDISYDGDEAMLTAIIDSMY